MIGGIIPVYKPVGIVSHRVVETIRKVLGVKVGHAGTLDPFARGLLLICWGKATRFTSFFQDLPKTYRAWIRFGISTDSFDVFGQINNFSLQTFTTDNIEKAIMPFQGTRHQVIPLFSATKYQGHRLYKYARQGKSVPELKKEITIHQLQIINIQSGSFPQAEILLSCSSGTYIRSIAHEIGEQLGGGGYVYSLRRENIGNFSWIDSMVVSDVSHQPEILIQKSIPIDQALYWIPSVLVSSEEGKKLLQGNPINWPESLPLQMNPWVKIYTQNLFIGLAHINQEKRLLHPKIVVEERSRYVI
ncbi:MAG TPA: tRNA pseudouridine(55) synthase TruB [Atribacter sp.]|jgi:tRNA pseudouridine55 synthase|uniref:tRNA pseudouridine(55) synthase TruB n=1 Tax=Atribacter sp. TaxID=2847780 RepID=UPI002B5FA8AB|nr:tRNA pseudouridine(55) synthase TruB [Atribacter sp.]MDD3713260.1 tRNA pseudouridine(55) synthase TruB [Atribacterota bacterium]MDI9595779.1 tRNA pseudouridine(55) synthase TruB [Atribacterota bacterium]HOT04799.1 tRNA pseudouridine(55) synthase TruB [Atribacter sp.]HQK82562.1 tRNA pseudouridine(55) synthase TruB [Atribacter sp.]